MSRRKRSTPRAGSPAAPAPGTPPSASRLPHLLAAGGIVITLFHTLWSRFALNPDGVAYLDLSARLLAGDVRSFVQGYWSPLYPALVAGAGAAMLRDPIEMLVVSHLLNGAAVVATIVLLWRWGTRAERPRFTLAALFGLLLVSNGLPRIEAVTPDVFSLALMAWLGYELLARNGERWILTGLVLGLAFLAKTSAWPWLLLSVPLRLWASTDRDARRRVLTSSAVATAIAALWVVPLSVKEGHFTAGSAARFNFCWYLEACDSRSPDTHSGRHVAYQETVLDSTHTVTWARFNDADRWTYAPWSDPTAWQAGVQTMTTNPLMASGLLPYWGRQARLTFLYWLLPVLFAVAIPWCLLEWTPAMWRLWWPEHRTVTATAALGLAGVLQFVMVHSEPRLIAPSAFLLVLAILHHTPAGEPPPARPFLRRAVTLVALLTVGSFTYTKLREGWFTQARLSRTLQMLATKKATLAASGISQERVVVLGPGIAVMAAAYLSEAHIVAQVLPGSVDALFDRAPAERGPVLSALFGGMAQTAWLTTPDGRVTLLVIERPDTTTHVGRHR